MWRALFPVVVLALAGCSHFGRQQARHTVRPRPEIELAAATDDPGLRTVYVMSNGFHTGLIVRNRDVPRDLWPEVEQIPEHPWVEVGWGSEIFYRAKKITAPVVVGAVLPNASVLHVVGWDDSPESVFRGGDLIRLEVDESQFAALCEHVHRSYEPDSAGQPQDLGPGIYGDGRFFRARGKYYFPNTCNVWTARGLQAAGVAIVPELCGAADAVLLAVRNQGTTIWRR